MYMMCTVYNLFLSLYEWWESNPHAITDTAFLGQRGYRYTTLAYLVPQIGFEPTFSVSNYP